MMPLQQPQLHDALQDFWERILTATLPQQLQLLVVQQVTLVSIPIVGLLPLHQLLDAHLEHSEITQTAGDQPQRLLHVAPQDS
uniref:Uncharacterized protein n=1 Tax=Lutzomyia longipalpis TaxID=7200 RepID=A0A1B0CWS3_LUTLO